MDRAAGQTKGTFRFGPFAVDSRTRQLLRDGREVPLSPKAFQLLLLLVSNRERAMSKEELHQGCGLRRSCSRRNLASLIAEIRRALDDDAAKPQFVRTMHRFGYRFVGPVDDGIHVAGEAPTARKVLACVGTQAGAARTKVQTSSGAERTHRYGSTRRASPGITRESRSAAEPRRSRISGSKNGTFVGGEPVTAPRPLDDGDQIRLGSIVVKFRIPGFSDATETAS